MTRIDAVLLLPVLAAVGACSDTEPGAGQEPSKQPAMPSAPAEAKDPNTASFEFSGVKVEPGTEAMYCHYLAPLDRDLVVHGFDTVQARGGHHLIVYQTSVPKPAGTIEDCSTGESMINLQLVLTDLGAPEPGTSQVEFPENHVVLLKAGAQLVAQSHYVNPTDAALLTQDKLRIHTTSKDLSTLTRMYIFVAGAALFEIPALADDFSASAGCALEKDLNFVALMPHMHQWGKRIDLQVGTAGAMRSIMKVDEWTPDMRDLPPVTSFIEPSARAAGHYAAGTAVALTCTWHNTESQPIRFPTEMCGAVGYFTSTAPGADDIMCIGIAP